MSIVLSLAVSVGWVGGYAEAEFEGGSVVRFSELVLGVGRGVDPRSIGRSLCVIENSLVEVGGVVVELFVFGIVDVVGERFLSVFLWLCVPLCPCGWLVFSGKKMLDPVVGLLDGLSGFAVVDGEGVVSVACVSALAA